MLWLRLLSAAVSGSQVRCEANHLCVLEVAMMPGQTSEMGRYAFRFDGVERAQGPNYVADRGLVQVFRDDAPLALLHPEKRAYASGGQVMTDAGIHAGLFADVFVALGEPLGDGAWAVRMQV